MMRRSRASAKVNAKPEGPVIVLVRPQLGENVGAAARAMLNCGLGKLRLVVPRDGWPNESALAAASGADSVLAAAELFATAEEAVADLVHVFAATARSRDMIKPTVAPRAAAERMCEREAAGEACGVLFGPERSGLTNDEVVLGDTVLAVPVNPAFSSLNLAHAVLIVAYEWRVAAASASLCARADYGATRPATKAELLNLFDHLERELDEAGFLHVVEKRPIMVRNIRNLFQRAELTEQEVRTLHGIVTGLSGRRCGGRDPD